MREVSVGQEGLNLLYPLRKCEFPIFLLSSHLRTMNIGSSLSPNLRILSLRKRIPYRTHLRRFGTIPFHLLHQIGRAHV